MSVSANSESPLGKLGRYELITPIGRGGMAEVHLALQRGPAGFEKLVVVKLVHDHLASEKAFVEMLLDEAKLAAQLKHPNVVDVYELGEVDGRYFIAMEYLEGESMLAVLEAGFTGHRLDPLSMARLIADAAEGLDAAHTLKSRDGKPLGIVHHDISLGNLFVLYSGQVKLLDFGVAKASRSAARRERDDGGAKDKVFGKLAYMSPEKLDERPGDRRSDIWSLGCVLWEALTLKRLFKGANDIELIREVRYVNIPAPSSVNPAVPAELDPVVLKALQRDPFKRYQHARELGAAIEEVLTAKAYGAKNYRISGYMQATFADRIAARERLLREVSGEARPSAEVIDAAFGDKRDATLPSLEHILNPPASVTLPEDHTGAAAMVPMISAGPNPFEREDDVAETVYDEIPANAEASRALRSEPDPSWNRGRLGESLRELQRKIQDRREHPERRRALLPLAAGAVLLLVLVIVLISTCGDEPEATPTRTSEAPAGAATPRAVAPVTPATVPAPATAPTAPARGATATGDPGGANANAQPGAQPDEAAPGEIQMRPDPPRRKRRARPRPAARSAQSLYDAGIDQLRRNDARAALASFTEARRADPGFAPAWYGLGMVHEKLGKKGAAKAAYQRYLSLVPRAANAQQVRERIERM